MRSPARESLSYARRSYGFGRNGTFAIREGACISARVSSYRAEPSKVVRNNEANVVRKCGKAIKAADGQQTAYLSSYSGFPIVSL